MKYGRGSTLSVGSLILTLLGLPALNGCDGSNSNQLTPTASTKLSCDDSIKTGFKPDANTTVLSVKAYKKGDPLVLSEPVTAQTPLAANDLCMVKLNVGPGNPGPASAPSTSPGIGLEVWLPSPANWNKRVHVLGSGGWGGGTAGSTAAVMNQLNAGGSPAAIAATEGAISAITDTGHSDELHGGSFAMNPDGTVSTAQWTDFSTRSVHALAVQTKALATAYYGSAPLYSYFDGGSMGGREAFTPPQVFPGDFDGILAAFPVINWTMLITAELYPWTVIEQDLGGVPLTTAQLDLVSNASISACDVAGGQHLGYIIDPSQCRYDPTKDTNVLCAGGTGNGGAVGTNRTAACVNLKQATAINKIWYGMTSDGSVPDPAVDNGWSPVLQGEHRWYGAARGASLYGPNFAPGGAVGASPNGPFVIAADMVALELQNPTIAQPSFVNATGNGAAGWKNLSYAQLSNAFDRGIALQGEFDNVNANNPDMSAFKARGGKILLIHGLADEAVYPQGSVNYYEQVEAKMGGLTSVQSFFRLYLLPGVGHGFMCAGGGFSCNDGSFADSFANGTSNLNANPPVPSRTQMYLALQNWVEKGIAPDTFPANTPSTSPVAKSLPLCAYPKKITFVSGDPIKASSYTCQ
ncbi:tannase/feruloyl esterase family alpha/beta hydrolase [Paraburkholderia sp. BL27I4N3]|uniref:tannase/feruloyl esterase family alpha/beta hydrolase n=1 Tax=Paraburkholderia sp. BL27I4N3 TaxID=1938805 RepID=UPI0015F27B4A|nr:tannase/feruloyl esterase family alpha/beta hydrolase [Paraburkholderia sp. BL27I4N3]